jgi:small subunit ribosomal protein S17
MAKDDDTTPDEAPETPAVDETPVAEDVPVAEEAPVVEDAPVADEAPAEDAVDEEAPAEDAVEAATEAPAEAAVAGPGVTRKAQRAEARHVETSKRAARTPEERHAERTADRKRKAAQRTRRREKAKAARPAERGPQKTASTAEHGPGRPKVRQGLVISDKADKTITVRIESARRHRRYEKIVRSSSTLHAHDEANDANAGDLVRIVESRPLSRLKRWRLVEVLERAK